MRILSARIFSKSFGGKIKPVQTDVNKETTFAKKNWHHWLRKFDSSNISSGKVDFTDNNKWQKNIVLKTDHKFLAKVSLHRQFKLVLKIVLDKLIGNNFTQSNQMFFSAQLCNVEA